LIEVPENRWVALALENCVDRDGWRTGQR